MNIAANETGRCLLNLHKKRESEAGYPKAGYGKGRVMDLAAYTDVKGDRCEFLLIEHST
jgi:hypothetical protein